MFDAMLRKYKQYQIVVRLTINGLWAGPGAEQAP